ncbi:juvenile hormone esterase [Bombyx mori]|uniref:Carboxylesterase type B domain-containing protein n=1 Tax=Bombyx mori TaxID=7091 RepID=A0A8R2ALI7_BOMMO|nr:juvenile hormone esterase [Bombyx mori]
MDLYRALFLLLFLGYGYSDENFKIVETAQGKIEGALCHNGYYYEFLGVRYGVPENFKAPKEPPSFAGVYKADNRAVLCPQFPVNDPLAAPSDNMDCLVLNVYMPKIPSNTSFPVMVFIHGGGFGTGSGSPTFYGPQYLVSHGVVLVTVNYRLNAYGFLNLHTKDAPGNAGLKDIRAALRWIQKNIANFNGDPDNVTVFGQGTGGTAAIYMAFSDSTQGLFHKIISESGTPFAPQSFDPDPLATAKQVARSLELITEEPSKLFKLYNDAPVVKLEEAIGMQMNSRSVFVPSVETVFDDEEPFLIDTPYNILKKKKFQSCPMIMGMNTVEGLTSTMDFFTVTSQMNRIMNEDYSALDQRSMVVPKKEREEFREVLKETYFSNTTSDEALIGGIINLNSDFSCVGPMSLFAEMYANSSSQPMYQYIFNYIGTRNLGKLLTNSSLPATSNLDELFYIFELERMPLPLDENDARIITFMTMMWTNFAKTGCPTPDPENGEWLPYPHNLAIALEPLYVAPLTSDRAHFWRTLYEKYGAELI